MISFLNVNINVSISDYSFKYICVVCYLKLRFYCLNCSAMSNLNSQQLISQHRTVIRGFNSQVKQKCYLSFKIRRIPKYRNKTNTEILQIQICEIQICQIHILICQRQISPVNILFVSKTPLRYVSVFKTYSGHVFKAYSKHVFKTS